MARTFVRALRDVARSQRPSPWRARVALLFVVLVPAVAVPPGSPRGGDPPRTDTRVVRPDGWQASGAPAAGAGRGGPAWVRSAPVDAGDTVLVGADWGGREGVTVEVRARRDGAWQPWQRLHLPESSEHGPDPGTAEAARQREGVSEPVWVGESERLQVRVAGAGAEPDVALHGVDVSGGDGLDYVPSSNEPRAGAAYAAADRPEIISREGWSADERLRRYVPVYADRARFTVVHHTATSNDYSREEADDIVNSIYRYHTVTRGWNDIAYNFLIDKYGNVYEGRAGGVTRPVMGAHAAGWNLGSVGIAMIGDHRFEEPTPEAEAALQRLLAWVTDVHHLDPHGSTVEVAGGGGSNRYPRGEHVEVPVVSAHQVTNNTSCPGDHLMDVLFEGSGSSAEPRQGYRDDIEATGAPRIQGGPPQEREQPRVGIRPEWDTTFTETGDWRLTVRDAEGDLVRSTGGTAADGTSITWDLRDGDGDLVPPGEYVTELTMAGQSGAARPLRTDFTVTPAGERFGGENRVSTAVKLSQWGFPSARRVVVASSEAFPDALVASPLAGSFGGPVLLVPSDHVPDDVVDEINRLGSEQIWIIGGTARIPGGVAEELGQETGTEVHRLAGPTRFETAAEVARLVIDREHPHEMLLARGAHLDPSRAFPDALAAGAFGAHRELPVLLVSHVLPGPTAEVLAEHHWPEGLTVFGGSAAISEDVAAQARDATDDAPLARLGGETRYDTARLAAQELLRRWEQDVEENGADPNAEPTGLEAVLASGANWPDALGAGAAAARRGSPFLLVPPDELGDGPSRAWLESHAADLAHGVVSGGSVAIADEVLTAVRDIVRSAGPHQDPPEAWPPDPHSSDDGSLPLPGPTGSETSPSPSPS